MSSIEDLLGKPFVTSTGKTVPEYALPIVQAYCSVLPLGKGVKNYKSPITPEVAADTITALGETLKKLNNGQATDNLKLLPPEEYGVLSKFSSSLPVLPRSTSVKGSTLYAEQFETIMNFAEGVWLLVRKAFELPHFDAYSYLYSKNKHYEDDVIDSKYGTVKEKRGIQIWGAQLSVSLASLGATIPLGFTLDSFIPATISGVIAGLTFMPGPMLWDLYGEKVGVYRNHKFYRDYINVREAQVQQEMQSYILQTQMVNSEKDFRKTLFIKEGRRKEYAQQPVKKRYEPLVRKANALPSPPSPARN